ncbi:hypothetical protein ACFFRR_006326 [Megaselia abdita]
MKIGRVRRRKKYRTVQNKRSQYLATLYLWWVFGTSLQNFQIIPEQTQTQSIFRCNFVIMVSAGFIETDELINELDRPVPITSVEGVLQRQAMLPCDITPMERDDAVAMVLWFKENDGEPLYSFDVRGRQFNHAKLWSSPTAFGSRAYFSSTSHPAQLKIDDIKLTDEGIYRCRVDFKNSPTRNLKINLTVIVPPEKPIIYDSTKQNKLNNVEAYNEGSDVVLACETIGGRPRPNVTWYLDNTVIDESFEQRPDGRTINHLLYPNIGRQHLNSRLTCVASNTNLTPPNNKVIVLDVNLKPLSVVISTKEKNVSADKTYDVECKASGSKPAAVITWWKGNKQLKKMAKNFSEADNTSLSVLTITIKKEDDGKFISCRAENQHIFNSMIEDKFKLNVLYPPTAEMKMGLSLNPEDIKEGDDVYFECKIEANPKPYKMFWYRNGKEIQHNASVGILLTDQSLVLQSVSKTEAGDYTCAGINTEGKGTSTAVALKIRYVPNCISKHEQLLGALKMETILLICEVDAYPPSDSFQWTFNSSGEQTELPSRLQASETGQSRLNYTPISDMDYGSISCWGKNAVGRQHHPCVFQIVAAGRPFPPHNCTVHNQTFDSLEIDCLEGFDGGLPQGFLLELVELSSLQLVRNLTLNRGPVNFFLDNLQSGSFYRIIIFSVNIKGRSEPLIIDDVQVKDAAKLTGNINSTWTITLPPFLAGLSILCALLFGIACIILMTMYRRYSNNRTGQPVIVKPSTKHAHKSVTPSDCQLDPLQTDQHNLEASNQSISGTSINTPLGLGGMGMGLGSSVVGISKDINRHSPKAMDDPMEIDETDPDVIPNQYEKRPLKIQVPNTYYRNPTTRLLQRDFIDSRQQQQQQQPHSQHLYHQDGSTTNIGSLVSGNEVVYTFRPSKQLSYATLTKGNKGVTTCSPGGQIHAQVNMTPHPMEVSLSSPRNQSVTSSLSEYRFRPEIVTTSNRIQESCI